VNLSLEEMQERLAAFRERKRHETPWWEQHAPLPAPRVHGLSQAQKALLVRLYRETVETRDRYGAARGSYRPKNPELCGIEWWTHGSETDNERSHAASQSRTLHRLADRGLVVRLRKDGQTTYVRFTTAGWTLAEQLIQGNG
jgi:hypothetical protein